MAQRTSDLAKNPRGIADGIQQIGEFGIMMREIISINCGKPAIIPAMVGGVVATAAPDHMDAKPRNTRGRGKRPKQERDILINTRHTVGATVQIDDRDIKFV
jgi:hypothetical protein